LKRSDDRAMAPGEGTGYRQLDGGDKLLQGGNTAGVHIFGRSMIGTLGAVHVCLPFIPI
jgi:hypothetical protein